MLYAPATGDHPSQGVLGPLLIGLLGAAAVAAVVLAGGYGIVAAFLCYSLGGGLIVFGVSFGRLALASRRTHAPTRAARPPASSTFA